MPAGLTMKLRLVAFEMGTGGRVLFDCCIALAVPGNTMDSVNSKKCK